MINRFRFYCMKIVNEIFGKTDNINTIAHI
jgi:hypothetical protein